MTDRIKTAFEDIRAEEALKAHTLEALQKRVQTKPRPRRYLSLRRLSAAVACLVLFACLGLFSHSLYFTEAAYIDLDINPSLGLSINRFGRVIGAEAYNADAEALLQALELRHEPVLAAMEAIMDAAAQSGALRREGLVSATVLSVTGDEAALLRQVQTGLSAAAVHHGGAAVDVFSVDSGTRDAAHELHISPAKYLAIVELQALEPTVTIEECRDHSIGELHRRIAAHGGEGHHGEDPGNTGAGNGMGHSGAGNDTADNDAAGNGGNLSPGHRSEESTHHGNDNGHGGSHK